MLWALITALALLVVTASSAWSTSIIAASIEELTLEADAIVVARVTRVDSTVQLSQNQVPAVERRVSLTVEEWWKEPARVQAMSGQALTIRAYGGRNGELATRVAGADEYAEGERVLVFLRWNESQEVWESSLLAWSKFRVDINGTEDVAIRDIDGLRALDVSQGLVRKSEAPGAFSLDAMREAVERALDEVAE